MDRDRARRNPAGRPGRKRGDLFGLSPSGVLRALGGSRRIRAGRASAYSPGNACALRGRSPKPRLGQLDRGGGDPLRSADAAGAVFGRGLRRDVGARRAAAAALAIDRGAGAGEGAGRPLLLGGQDGERVPPLQQGPGVAGGVDLLRKHARDRGRRRGGAAQSGLVAAEVVDEPRAVGVAGGLGLSAHRGRSRGPSPALSRRWVC